MNEQTGNTADAVAPPPSTPRDIIREHGPAGGLVLTLRRYAFLGWLFFGGLLLVVSLYVVAAKITGTPVLAVDEGGRVLGTFEYIDDDYRTSDEYSLAIARWLGFYLSYNSATIYSDIAIAASAMYDDPNTEDDARGKYLATLQTTNRPNVIAESESHSHIEFDEGSPRVVTSNGGVRVVADGEIIITTAGVTRPQRFSLTIPVRAVRRNSLYALGTLGVQVLDVLEN